MNNKKIILCVFICLINLYKQWLTVMIIWIGIHSKIKRCMHDEIKFGLSEKHTKFEKIFLMVLTNQLVYLVNVKTMRKIFFKLCVLLKKSEL